MEKPAQSVEKLNQEYLEAQIQKINHSLLTHQQQISKIEELTAHIHRHTKKIAELEQKLKLIETFQSQNFMNNERLFNSHGKLDTIQKKVMILQQAQFKFSTGRSFQEGQIDNHFTQKLETRIRQIEIQLQKNKQKSQSLVKFKRQLSPRPPNCQSTNDISIDQGNMKLQIKKIEKKLHQSLMQKFANLEKKLAESLQPRQYQQPQTFTPNRFIRETRVKNKTNTNQKTEQNHRAKTNLQFKNHFDSYYNEDTSKTNRLRTERKNNDQNYSLKPKLKSKTKKQKSSSKSLSKQKSSKQLKSNEYRKQSKQTKLSAVNEYLRLLSKNK